MILFSNLYRLEGMVRYGIFKVIFYNPQWSSRNITLRRFNFLMFYILFFNADKNYQMSNNSIFFKERTIT